MHRRSYFIGSPVIEQGEDPLRKPPSARKKARPKTDQRWSSCCTLPGGKNYNNNTKRVSAGVVFQAEYQNTAHRYAPQAQRAKNTKKEKAKLEKMSPRGVVSYIHVYIYIYLYRILRLTLFSAGLKGSSSSVKSIPNTPPHSSSRTVYGILPDKKDKNKKKKKMNERNIEKKNKKKQTDKTDRQMISSLVANKAKAAWHAG